MKARVSIVLIVVVILIMVATLAQPLFAVRNVGLYYNGRYFVVKDAEGIATIIDLEQAKCYKIRNASGGFLILGDNWSSGLTRSR